MFAKYINYDAQTNWEGWTGFVHGSALGSTGMMFEQGLGVTLVQDEVFYPWGQRWSVPGTAYDERFAGMSWHDYSANLDPTRVAQTLTCNVCDAGCGVPMPLESEVESSHVLSAGGWRRH